MLLLVQGTGKSKIAHFENPVFGDQQVFWLYVSMDDIVGMNESYGSYQLPNDLLSIILIDALWVLLDVLQYSPVYVLEHKIDFALVSKNFN